MSFFKLGQMVLNNIPSSSTGYIKPITGMMCLEGDDLAQLVPIPCGVEPMSLEAIMTCRKAELDETRAVLDGLHKEMSAANQKKRDQSRRLHANKYGVQMAQFGVGDFA